jgi:uncharacterized membrane protein YeaQ/YmgE (transglycosylase-associated protein family)
VPSRQGEDNVIGVDSLIIMLIVGAIAGWLAGQIVRGFGFGLIWNMVIGIVGAFIGVWLLRQLGFMPFAGFVGSIVNATIGAVILLVIVGFIRRLRGPCCGRVATARRLSAERAHPGAHLSARPQTRLDASRR